MAKYPSRVVRISPINIDVNRETHLTNPCLSQSNLISNDLPKSDYLKGTLELCSTMNRAVDQILSSMSNTSTERLVLSVVENGYMEHRSAYATYFVSNSKFATRKGS